MPWRPKLDAKKLKKQNDELALQLLRTREQLQQKEGYLVGMEVLLDQRAERIDRLTVQVDKLRAQNKRLDQENAQRRSCPRPPVAAPRIRQTQHAVLTVGCCGGSTLRSA